MVPSTGELLLNKPSWFNYETVIQSIRDFINNYSIAEGKRLYLVLDNAPWHKKAYRLIQKEELPEYDDIREKLELVNLPPYSPDLNPIEQCWRVTRREVTHNRYFANVSQLESALNTYFTKYRSPNAKFATLCSFKHRI